MGDEASHIQPCQLVITLYSPVSTLPPPFIPSPPLYPFPQPLCRETTQTFEILKLPRYGQLQARGGLQGRIDSRLGEVQRTRTLVNLGTRV